MSETLSQDPEGYSLAPAYPPTPATPSSTVQDVPGAHLPPFSTFGSDMDPTAFSAALSDSRLLDISSSWDYYNERIMERGENGLSIITSQPQYRPWESKSAESAGFTQTTPVNTFADAFAQNGGSKLPSFQSQFQTFNETVTTTEPTTLTTLTNLTPISPNSSPSLTTLNSNFHTLSAVNARNYPLVPAPIQAREIPSIQQQFLDERHIQLYTHPNTFIPAQNGAILQNIAAPTVVTLLKSEPEMKLDGGLKMQGLHPGQFQNPMDNGMYNGLDKKLNGIGVMGSPTRNDFRKKERRKMRASSMESSAESDGASSNMEIGGENSGQVAAVSSTAGFKTHHSIGGGNNAVDMDEISGGNVDKQVKKKRKRCGECIGCQRKDNCGDCAPCRNDKSHQICKQRRCEKLTEKKNLYGEASYLRGESRRGRGKGRGAGSYRGRKPSGSVSSVPSGPSSGVPPESNGNVTIISSQPAVGRPSPQPPVTTVQQSIPVQQQAPMTPMPFYADPNRFTTPVWQTDPSQGWPQGQFIQQIPAGAQPPLEGYQQYPNGIYQATYQQPAAFESNTFYAGAVQVLTSARPPSAPEHRTGYVHTPSPAPSGPPGRQYQDYGAQQGFVSPATTPSANAESLSRPSSVNSTVSNPTPNQNFQQQGQGNFTTVPTSTFSPGTGQNYAASGNAEPGYPQVSSSPQLASHSSSGYPGSGQYSGTSHEMWQDGGGILWERAPDGQADLNTYTLVQQAPIDAHHHPEQFSQADRVNLNTRIKTMILSKHQQLDEAGGGQEDAKNKIEQQPNNNAGHFLWYSHHHRLRQLNDGGGNHPRANKPKLISTKTTHITSPKHADTEIYTKQHPIRHKLPNLEAFVSGCSIIVAILLLQLNKFQIEGKTPPHRNNPTLPLRNTITPIKDNQIQDTIRIPLDSNDHFVNSSSSSLTLQYSNKYKLSLMTQLFHNIPPVSWLEKLISSKSIQVQTTSDNTSFKDSNHRILFFVQFRGKGIFKQCLYDLKIECKFPITQVQI